MTQRGQHPGQFLRLVRSVGVQLDQHVVAALEPPAESGQVRHTEPLLGPAVKNLHMIVLTGQGVSDLAGPVGAGVVDHQDVHVRRGHPQSGHDGHCSASGSATPSSS